MAVFRFYFYHCQMEIASFAYFSLMGYNSLVHELRIMTVVGLHLNAKLYI